MSRKNLCGVMAGALICTLILTGCTMPPTAAELLENAYGGEQLTSVSASMTCAGTVAGKTVYESVSIAADNDCCYYTSDSTDHYEYYTHETGLTVYDYDSGNIRWVMDDSGEHTEYSGDRIMSLLEMVTDSDLFSGCKRKKTNDGYKVTGTLKLSGLTDDPENGEYICSQLEQMGFDAEMLETAGIAMVKAELEFAEQNDGSFLLSSIELTMQKNKKLNVDTFVCDIQVSGINETDMEMPESILDTTDELWTSTETVTEYNVELSDSNGKLWQVCIDDDSVKGYSLFFPDSIPSGYDDADAFANFNIEDWTIDMDAKTLTYNVNGDVFTFTVNFFYDY